MELVSRILLCLYLCVHRVTEAAQLDCDNGCKVGGTRYNLACTSVSSGHCNWYKGTSRVVSCAAGGICVSEEQGYFGIRISDSHYVLQIDSLTSRTFECRLGLDAPVSCTIAQETDIPSGTLTATCESDLITCAGITNHGTPAVAIELRKGFSVLTSTTSGGSVNIKQENSAGTTYTCTVTGNLANCLTTTSVEVTCPVVPVVNSQCGDVCSSTPGSSYTLSCSWSGTLTYGITWRRDGSNVMVCNTGGLCLPSTAGYATGSYPNSTTATLTINSFNATTDAGTWECSDGSVASQNCTLPIIASGSLNGQCTNTGRSYIITCNGIMEQGSPPAIIQIREGSTILASTTSGGSVSSIQTDAAGKTYSCSVKGAAAVCLTTKSVDVTCPASTFTSTTQILGKGIGIGVAICLPIILGLVVALVVILKKLRKMHTGDSKVTENQMTLGETSIGVRNTYADLSSETTPGNEYEQLQTHVPVEGSIGGYENVSDAIN